MSGLDDSRDRAQLALMDAVVFFAVCVVICAVMMSCVRSRCDASASDPQWPPDPSALLFAFTESSIGQRVVLDGIGVELTGHEQVAEALLFAASAIMLGYPSEALVPLASCLEQVLAGLCYPWGHRLSADYLGDDGWTVAFTFGDAVGCPESSGSSTRELGACGGSPVTTTLVLFPPLLPHGV